MTFQQAAEIWAGFVGNQSAQEFIELSRQQGLSTIEAAVDAYLADIPNMFPSDNISTDQLCEIRDGLLRYLAEHGYH